MLGAAERLDSESGTILKVPTFRNTSKLTHSHQQLVLYFTVSVPQSYRNKLENYPSFSFQVMAPATNYLIKGCTVADSDELTRNNIPAFWADPHWRLAWRHRTLEYHISQVAKRTPRNLLGDPETKRQQKAVDPDTGRIVGFARWYLPASHAKKADGAPVWPDAVVPAVSAEKEAEIQRVAKTTHWDPNEESDELLIPIREAKDGILGKQPYMRMSELFLQLTLSNNP